MLEALQTFLDSTSPDVAADLGFSRDTDEYSLIDMMNSDEFTHLDTYVTIDCPVREEVVAESSAAALVASVGVLFVTLL